MAERDDQREGIKGSVEDIKGKTKETAGTFLGNDEMEREGRAQQDKGQAQQDIADKEAEAQRARERAAEHEVGERSQQ